MTTIQNQNENKMVGSMGLENALVQNQGKMKYDEAAKKVLKHKEVLANILKYGVSEYDQYTSQQVMGYIDTDSITVEVAVAPDTDTRIAGDSNEETSTTEANLSFDVRFRVLEPKEKKFHIHFDVEPQNDYYPGYPLEKRGIYNLSRMISSQLEVVTKATNYSKLEKAYCIFICIGYNLPKYLWNTVSYYSFTNTKNTGEITKGFERWINQSDLDLMELVMIRIGNDIPESVDDLVHFLHGVFFNMEEVEKYIDFSKNEEFREEMKYMSLLGDHLIQLGEDRAKEKVLEEKKRADAEKERADQAEERAEQEKNRAEQAEERAEQEAKEKEELRIQSQKQIEDLMHQLEELKKSNNN